MPCTYKEDGIVCGAKSGKNTNTGEDYPYCRKCFFKVRRERNERFRASALRVASKLECQWVSNHPVEGFKIKCGEPPVRDGWCRLHKNFATTIKSNAENRGFEDGDESDDLPTLPQKGRRNKKINIDNVLNEVGGSDLDSDPESDEPDLEEDNVAARKIKPTAKNVSSSGKKQSAKKSSLATKKGSSVIKKKIQKDDLAELDELDESQESQESVEDKESQEPQEPEDHEDSDDFSEEEFLASPKPVAKKATTKKTSAKKQTTVKKSTVKKISTKKMTTAKKNK